VIIVYTSDKHEGDGKKEAEKKFIDVGEAYEILSDPGAALRLHPVA
jgi:DnaJ-class molecular chaperone